MQNIIKPVIDDSLCMFDPSFYETSFIFNEVFERVMSKLKHLHYIRFAFLIVIKAVFFTNWMGKKNNITRQHYAKKVYISNMLNNEIWDKNYNF